MSNKILVTGGAGFIGSNFIKSVDVDEFSVIEEQITPAGIENVESVTASFVEFPLSLTLADDWFYAKTENN